MKRNLKLRGLLGKAFNPVYNPDTLAGGNGNDTVASSSGNDTVVGGNGNDPPEGDPELIAAKLTPEQQKLVNKRVQQEKLKAKSENDKTIAQLRQLQQSVTTTEKQKQEMEQRIQELSAAHMSKEELQRKEKEKTDRERAEEKRRSDAEIENWKTRYTTSTIRRAISDVATVLDAYNPAQIVNILERDTRLVDELDSEGKPTGEMIPKVRYVDTDEKGKSITLELTVQEAIKRMKETPDLYGNLFKSGVNGGLGQSGGTGGRGKSKAAKDLTTPEYMEKRQKDKELKFTRQ